MILHRTFFFGMVLLLLKFNSEALGFPNQEVSDNEFDHEIDTAEKLGADAMAGENDTVEAFKNFLTMNNRSIEHIEYELYKLRPHFSLEALKKVVPLAQGLRVNFSNFIHNPKDSLHGLKLANKELDAQLKQIQDQLQKNSVSVAAFDAAFNNAEEVLEEVQQDALNLMQSLFMQQAQVEKCGGIIDVSTTPRLEWVTNVEHTCVWFLWSSTSNQLNLKALRQPTNRNLLKIYSGFPGAPSSTNLVLKSVHSFVSPVALVLSKSQEKESLGRRQSFALKMEPSGDPSTVRDPQFHILPVVGNTKGKLSYPGNGTLYQNNERTFFLATPPPNKKYLITVTKIDTEGSNYDFLDVYRFTTHGIEYMTRKEGRSQRGAWKYEGFTDKPMLLFFRSDGGSEFSGFDLSYEAV